MKIKFSTLTLVVFAVSLKTYGDDVTNAISKQSPKGIFFSQTESGGTIETQDHLSLIAVGDILLHKPLHVQALKNSDGHISLWKNLEGLIKSADLAYANLEGPVAPGVSRSGSPTHDPGKIFDNSVYTSYPRFNYHEELVEDLVKSGFDVVSTANNHALDRGGLGIDKTIEILNKNKLAFTGTKTQHEADSSHNDWYTIVEKNGFRIAWIACTYSTNGITDRHNQVLNCFNQSDLIVNTIKTLSQDRHIDAIMVTPHTGVEYEDAPRRNSVNLYRSFIEAGAIAVLGSHPHVLQPWEKYTALDKHEGLIIYSLGNFVSGQFHKVYTRATLMLTVDLIRDRHGKTAISQVHYLPLEMTSSGGLLTVKAISPHSGTNSIYNHIIGMFGTQNLFDISAIQSMPLKISDSAQSKNQSPQIP
jgi:poly-gamma-glutamate synthesis protein (capsule biosynthesis protein)